MNYSIDDFVGYITEKYPNYNPTHRTKEDIYKLGRQLEPDTKVEPWGNFSKPIVSSKSFYPNPSKINISPNTFDMQLKNMENLTDSITKKGWAYLNQLESSLSGKPSIKEEASQYFYNNMAQQVGTESTIGSVYDRSGANEESMKIEHDNFVEQTFNESYEREKKTAPYVAGLYPYNFFKTLANNAGALVLNNSGYGMIDENSSNAAKYGWNESLDGLSYQLMYGKKKFDYDVENYAPSGALEGAYAGMIGIVTPLSLASMAIGGGIGGFAVKKTLSNQIVKKIAKRNLLSKGLETRFLVSNLNKKMVNKIPIKIIKENSDMIADAMYKQSIVMGSQFAVLDAARANLQAKVDYSDMVDRNGNPITEEQKSKLISSETIKGASHGFMLGGLAGYGAGAIGKYYEALGQVFRGKKLAGIKLTPGEIKLLKKSEGLRPRAVKVGYEVGVFTSPTIVDEWEGLKAGQAESYNKIFQAATTNFIMVGGMNTVSSLMGKTKDGLKSFQNEFKKNINDRMIESERLNSIEQKLTFEKNNATGASKEALDFAIKEVRAERSKVKTDFESTNGSVEKIKLDLENSLKEISQSSGNMTAEGLNRQMTTFSKALKTLNEYVGLTGDKEMAKLLNRLEAEATTNIKNKIGSTIQTKEQLVNLYKSIKKTRNGNTEIILVERNGKPVTLKLKENLKDITPTDILEAIKLETKGSNKSAADLAISSIEKNNKIKDYNSTEDFIRGYKSSGVESISNLSNRKSYNVKNATNNKYSKKGSRDTVLDERAKNLGVIHEKISNDGGGSNMKYESRVSWHQSKSIMLNAIEKYYLDKIETNLSGAKSYRNLSSTNYQIKTLNEFAKFLALKKKNLYEVTNKDFIDYLKEFGNNQSARALKDFFESNKASLTSKNSKDIKFESFEAYSRLLSKPVTTGFESTSRIMESVLSKRFNFAIEDIRDMRELFTGYRRHKSMSLSEQNTYSQSINKMLSKKWQGRTPEIRGSEIKIELKRIKYGISEKSLSETLEAFGIKDGKFKNVRNAETVKQVESFFSEKLAVQDKTSFVKSFELSELDVINKSFPGVVKRFLSLTPAAFNVKKYVSKKIYQALTGSDLIQEKVMGINEARKAQIKMILPKASDRNMIKFIDKDRIREAKTQKELKFIEDLKKTGDVILDGKKIGVGEGPIPFDAVITGGSKAWQAKTHHLRFMNRVLELQVSGMRYSSKSKSQFNQRFAELEAKALENYTSRVVNPKLKETLVRENGKKQKWFKDYSKSVLMNNAKEAALKKGFREKTPQYKNFVENYIKNEKNITETGNQVYQLFYSDINAVNAKFLKSRTGLLGDENGNITYTNMFGRKKTMKAYIDKYDSVMDSYYKSMGQSIAVSMYFPELHPMAKGNKGVMSTERLASKIGVLNKAGSDYTVRLIKKNFGLEHKGFADLGTVQRYLGGVGLSVVTAGLSMPVFPGAKNFAIGQARNIGAYGPFYSAAGLMAVLSKKQRDKARDKGFRITGIQSLETSGLGSFKNFAIDKIFTYWNLMKPTEAINRVSSSVAARMYFENQLKQYKKVTGGLGKNREIRDVWKNRFKLSKDEINYIERNSLETILNQERNGSTYLSDKIGSQGHISTQGATRPNQLPLWMSNPIARPFTIFYRIAAHSTFDTYLNFIKPALKHKNPYPLVRLAVAHKITGAGLIYLYDEILGKENPFDAFDKTQEDESFQLYQKVGETLHDVNTSGLFGVMDFMVPYLTKTSQLTTATPMLPLVNVSKGMYSNLMQLIYEKPGTYTGLEWGADRFKNLIKEATAFGSQWDAQANRINENEYMIKRKNIRKAFNTWLSLSRNKRKFKDYDFSPRGYMMLNLKDAIVNPKLSKEEKIKKIMSTYNALVHEQMNDNVYGLTAHKAAVKSIKLSMNSLRPLHSRMGGEENIIKEEDLVEFYKTLTPGKQADLKTIDEEFFEIDKFLENTLESKRVLNKYSILGHVANMSKIETSPNNGFLFETDFYNSLNDEDKENYKKFRVFR